jgi:CDP-glucose 4,6-dehydratase
MVEGVFSDLYRDKTVLVTGHTGFKGSWLTAWLLKLGGRVVGISNGVPTTPSHFESARLGISITDLRIDIRDRGLLADAILRTQPDFVFHLAAQPLVRHSYREPVETLAVNLMGSAHVLDALRQLNKPCLVVMITSDKCYYNVEWTWGYRETDRLGGKDPYSASKGAAELAIHTFVASYFSAADCAIRVAVGRAGNVIGGGDWADDRIVPDCVRAWAANQPVEIRSPKATRPWQHVLEPLSGYLTLGAELSAGRSLNGEPFNFGPPAEQNHSVLALIEAIQQHWPGAGHVIQARSGQEAGLLKLNCDKALAILRWRATLDFAETVRMTADWYRQFYEQPGRTMLEITLQQIEEYVAVARERGLGWAQGSPVLA